MGKYYESGKVYSLQNWNDLIKDVNEILENPPAGTDCEPLEPIEEAESPYIWRKDDIEEVRGKLEETCPDIKFEKDLKLWKTEIIDEIEDEMEKAWCDCGDEEDETIYGPCEYPYEAVEAASSKDHCCGTLIESSIGHFLCGSTHYFEDVYMSPWYPEVDNSILFSEIASNYTVAFNATKYYMLKIEDLKELTKDIDNKQKDIDGLTESLDSMIQEHNDYCNGSCPSLEAAICEKGQQIRNYQDDLDDMKDKFDIEYPKIEEYFNEANTAAEVNWAAAAALVVRFPADANLIADCFLPNIPKIPWHKWFNPGCPYLKPCDPDDPDCEPDDCEPDDPDDKIGHVPYYVLGTRKDWEVRPKLSLGYTHTWDDGHTLTGAWDTKISPGGTPFVSQSVAQKLLRELSELYRVKQARALCNQWGSNYCTQPCTGIETPACQWSPWLELSSAWTPGWYFPWLNDCADKTGVEIAEDEAKFLGSISAEAKLEHLPGIKSKDFVEKQEEFWGIYENWFNYHPQYDDRHEIYC